MTIPFTQLTACAPPLAAAAQAALMDKPDDDDVLTDDDGLTWSPGSMLVQYDRHSWHLTSHYMGLDPVGMPDLLHALTVTPQELADAQLSHERLTPPLSSRRRINSTGAPWIS